MAQAPRTGATGNGSRRRAPARRTRMSTGKTALIWAGLVLVVVLLLMTWGHARIVLLGVDRGPGDVGRTDTMLVMEPQLHRGRVVMLSVPRDTRVELPGAGTSKINAIFPRHGPVASTEAVAHLLQLPLDGYVLLDFDAVRSVVNALGGVTLHVDQRMYYHDPYQDLLIDLQPGSQRLDGEQALGFVRYRGGPHADIGRVQRQRQFVAAVLREVVQPGNWPRIPLLLTAWQQNVESDVSTLRLVGFGAAAVVASWLHVEDDTVPGTTATIGGASYWITDEAGTRATVRELFQPAEREGDGQ